MDFPIQTLSQLRPILQGFRKENALTQAALAAKIGITQQSYAELEANPASVSVERLFKVLSLLNVGILLTSSSTKGASEVIAPTEGLRTVASNVLDSENKGAQEAKTLDSPHKSESW
nr:helix-turn-helix transcriptional regulator [uncultured Deefgea sp.]